MEPPATTNGRAQEGLATRPEGFGLTTPFPKLCPPARQGGDSYGLSTEELSFLSESDKDWVMGRAIVERLKWT